MKKIMVLLTVVIMICSFAACSGGEVISKDDAIAKAIEHSGIPKEDISFSKAEYDVDDGRKIYEVELRVRGLEYDYEIDAQTGEIIKYDGDYEVVSENGKEPQDLEVKAIAPDEAKDIALEQVPGATESNVSVLEDYDNGKLYYDVTVVYGDIKYEFEIDSASGAITETDKDSVYDD